MADTTLIQGRYRLLELIGRGGMGEVWRAVDESLHRRVAVKCLKPLDPGGDRAFTQVLRERFRREARVAAALQHRGVTVVHDFGEQDGLLYLVMELLDGDNLSQLLERNANRPLDVPDVLEVAEQISAALAYTHDQGIVHRDLKPANVMRTRDGTVKICDFGIARLGHDIGFTSKLTSTGVAMGTPHYMSPEQIAGRAVDHRSDLYSLGCVLYEIVTGTPPFDRGDPWAVLLGHRDTPPEPPRTHRPDLPEPLERVILQLLAKDPAARPDSAADLGRDLAEAREAPSPGGGLARPARPRPTGWTRGGSRGESAASRSSGAWPVSTATPPGQPPGGTDADRWTTEVPGPGEPPLVPLPRKPTAPPGSAPGAEEPAGPSPNLLATLASRHNTGLHLGRLGRWEEACEVHRSVAAEREALLGENHPATLASRYEVGFTLSRLGRHAEALEEYRRVATGRSALLGPDHSDTLAARQESAYVLGQLGRHEEAHLVYTGVLAARENTMGADHPDTLRCRHNLAFNLSRLGRLEDSYRMAREVAVARTRVLGAEHQDTLVTRYEVAYALGRLGRWAEALETYAAVAESRARTLGPEHPDTLAARYETGISLGRLGRSAEALELYADLVAARTRAQGPADPETLRARHGLGVNLGRLGRWEEALAEAREVCAIRERTLGPDHPDTLVSRREVAVGLGWLSRWAEALDEYRLVAAVRERVLGPDHPHALTSRNDEAHCLEQLGRSAEAVELYRQVATRRQQRASSAG
ncbi:serine/threonine protein kinase [Streptomyces sp. AJS327]|uniref:serine/threonine-protein kinase n=1 Tax=Streptomyces sp. AJS327 TaxID=2545265 RepID=UPI0015DFFD6A|nr:serine/threonine-protein kinase [Streptomyces sp. AJS327]MBA0051032.1 serine/threonine protein kinase [Streptomyces sp. AJS327]